MTLCKSGLPDIILVSCIYLVDQLYLGGPMPLVFLSYTNSVPLSLNSRSLSTYINYYSLESRGHR